MAFKFTLPNIIHGTTGSDTLYGTSGADWIYGNNGADHLYGGDGADVLYGGDGNDHLYGQDGNDVLYGGIGNDFLHGGAGNDTLEGFIGNDELYGLDGNDILRPGAGNDYINGGADFDTLDYSDLTQALRFDVTSAISGKVSGTGKLDNYTNIDKLVGSQGNDVFMLNASIEAHGGLGNDLFVIGSSGPGRTIDGGDGVDTVSYAQRNWNVNVDLTTGTSNEEDKLTGIENIIGGYRNDTLRGNGQANELRGDGGYDMLFGEGGDDRLIVGSGGGQATGGTGADRFVLESIYDSLTHLWSSDQPDQRLTIMDFNRAEGDKIELKGMGHFVFTGDLSSRSGSSNGDIHMMIPREIGFTSSGNSATVWINLNGSLASEMQIVVNGTGHLQASDFLFT